MAPSPTPPQVHRLPASSFSPPPFSPRNTSTPSLPDLLLVHVQTSAIIHSFNKHLLRFLSSQPPLEYNCPCHLPSKPEGALRGRGEKLRPHPGVPPPQSILNCPGGFAVPD